MKTVVDLANQIQDYTSAAKSIAPVENGSTSTGTYAIGAEFMRDGVLYKAKTAITAGDTLTLNTNYELASTVSSQISDVKQALSNEVSTRIKLGVHNLADGNNSYPYNSVLGSYSNGTFSNLRADTGTASFTVQGHKLDGTYVNLGSVPAPLTTGTKTITLAMADKYDFLRVGHNGASYDFKLVIPWNFEPDTYTLHVNLTGVNVGTANGYSFNNILITVSTDTNTEVTPYVPTNSQLLSYKDNGVLGAKNYLKNIATAETLNGVTFTVYDDGTVKVNGTASALTEKKVSEKLGTFLTDGQQYILNGCPANGSDSTYKLYDGTLNDNWNDYGDGVTVTYSSSLENKSIYIRIANGTTVSNLTFKPMIRLATDSDPTYQPYAMTNKELTDVAVQVNGNYMYKGNDRAIVTSDGVKDRETLLYEAATVMLTKLQALADDEIVFVKQVVINGGGVPITTKIYTPFKNTETSFDIDFSKIVLTVGTGAEILWGRFNTTKSSTRCAIQSLTTSGVQEPVDMRSNVPTSGLNYGIYYHVYKKIS